MTLSQTCMDVQACTIALPGFLQPWRRQIRVAGLQLRLLHGLPAPWCQLAADLSSAAAAEAAERRKASGALLRTQPQHVVCIFVSV